MRTKVRSTSRGQGRKGDRPSGGRLCDIHEPTNRNLIVGRLRQASWHNTAKPFISLQEVNQAVVWRRSAFLPGEICPTGRPAFERAAPGAAMRQVIGQKSAEAIVVASSRGMKHARINNETGTLDKAKGRTSLTDRPAHPSTAMNPTGGARNGQGKRAEKERLCGEFHPKRLRPGKVGSLLKSRKDWTGLPKPE